jgi:hypothetical protein
MLKTVMYYCQKKPRRATFWEIITQTHRVTVLGVHEILQNAGFFKITSFA